MISGLALRFLCHSASAVGGQAVMEGVMIRAENRLAIAVRKPDGAIEVQNRPWFSLTSRPLLKKPFLRGFPILLETLVNGISALNFSAQKALEEENQERKPWAMALTLAGSIGFALFLFVVVPHLFTLGLKALGLSERRGPFLPRLGRPVQDAGSSAISRPSLFCPTSARLPIHARKHKVIWVMKKDSP
jgi:hypothetical protein